MTIYGITGLDWEAFKGCSKLRRVNLPNLTSSGKWTFESSSIEMMLAEKLTTIQSCFLRYCRNLKQAYFPSATIVESGVFQGCERLTRLKLGDVTRIDSGAFQGCQMLSDINLDHVVTVDNNAFENCVSLTKLNLPVATEVRYSSFLNCSGLVEVHMPNVTNIGTTTFKQCTKIKFIDLSSMSESIVLSSYENWGIQSGCTIKCKDDSTGETKTIII